MVRSLCGDEGGRLWWNDLELTFLDLPAYIYSDVFGRLRRFVLVHLITCS